MLRSSVVDNIKNYASKFEPQNLHASWQRLTSLWHEIDFEEYWMSVKKFFRAFRTGRFKRQAWAGMAIAILSVLQIGEPVDIISDFFGAKVFSKEVSGNVLLVEAPQDSNIMDVAQQLRPLDAANVMVTIDENLSSDEGIYEKRVFSLSDSGAVEHTLTMPIMWWSGIEDVSFDMTDHAASGAALTPAEAASVKASGIDGWPFEAQTRIDINYLLLKNSFEHISLAEFQTGNYATKDRVVIFFSASEFPMFTVPAQKVHATPTEILALAYETQMNGGNLRVTAPAVMVPVLILAILILTFFRPPLLVFAVGGCISLIVIGQLLRPLGFHLEVNGGFVAIVALAIYTTDKRRRENCYQSNLKNVRALTDAHLYTDHAIISAKVRSFRPFTKGMPKAARIELVHAIENRLSILRGRAELYEIEQGTYVWTVAEFRKDKFFEQVESGRMIIEASIEAGGRKFQPTITFGIDLDATEALQTRIEDVQITVEEAEQNRLRWLVSDSAKSFAMQAELDLIPAILPAIENGEIYAVFQSKIDTKTRQVSGFEALARWDHPERGHISPEVFVRLAEDHGKIEELTSFMIRSAMVMSRDYGFNVPVSVNIQPISLTNDDLVNNVKKILAETGQAPHLLTLEITETNSMAEDQSVMDRLNEIDRMGVGLSIDDFGTGYSTIDYIRQIPAKELKLDRQFMKDLHSNERNKRLLQTTIELGHAVGLRVVVEGVELLEEVELLQTLGADTIQGYYFSKPMRPSGLLEHVNSFQLSNQNYKNYF